MEGGGGGGGGGSGRHSFGRRTALPLLPGSRQSECRGVIVPHVVLEGFTHVSICLFVRLLDSKIQ